jgi:hypothetical protein
MNSAKVERRCYLYSKWRTFIDWKVHYKQFFYGVIGASRRFWQLLDQIFVYKTKAQD